MTALYTQWLLETGPAAFDSGFYLGQLFTICQRSLVRFYCKNGVDNPMRTW